METFDSGSAGWIYGYGKNYTPGTTTWNSAGGNPGAYISGVASNLYAVWIYDPDTDVYGSLTNLAISIDLKIENTVSGNAQLYVGRGGTYYVGEEWSINSYSNWTTHVENTATFTRWASGGSDSLENVLMAPDDIGLFFGTKLVGGDGSILIDNFGSTEAIPEPMVISFICFFATVTWGTHRFFLRKDTPSTSL